jgi:hypothetical protein
MEINVRVFVLALKAKPAERVQGHVMLGPLAEGDLVLEA